MGGRSPKRWARWSIAGSMAAVAALALALAAARPWLRPRPAPVPIPSASPGLALAASSPGPGALDVSARYWVTRPDLAKSVRYEVAVIRFVPDGPCLGSVWRYAREGVVAGGGRAGRPILPGPRVPVRLDPGRYLVRVEVSV